MFVDGLQSNCSTRPPIGLWPNQSDALGPSWPERYEYILRASWCLETSTRYWTKCQANQGQRWCSQVFLCHTDSKPYVVVRHLEANTGNNFCSRPASSQRSEPSSLGPGPCIYSWLSIENVNINPIHRSDLEIRLISYWVDDSDTTFAQQNGYAPYLHNCINNTKKKHHHQGWEILMYCFPKPNEVHQCRNTIHVFSQLSSMD